MKYDAPDTENGKYIKYDKAEHFIAHAVLAMVIPTKKYNLDFWGSVFVGLIFELNDGITDYERTLGFSRVDFIFDIAGAMAGVFLKDLLHSIGIYILINNNGISIHF